MKYLLTTAAILLLVACYRPAVRFTGESLVEEPDARYLVIEWPPNVPTDPTKYYTVLVDDGSTSRMQTVVRLMPVAETE